MTTVVLACLIAVRGLLTVSIGNFFSLFFVSMNESSNSIEDEGDVVI